jgi:hypothetical protein
MSQLALVNQPADDVPAPPADKSIGALYRVIDSNLEMVGGLQAAADLMRINSADLRRALDAGAKVGTKAAGAKDASRSPGHRYLAIDHVIRFGERVRQYSTEAVQRLAIAIVSPWDLLVFPRVQMTKAEENRRLRALVLSMPLGRELLEHALNAPEPVVGVLDEENRR